MFKVFKRSGHVKLNRPHKLRNSDNSIGKRKKNREMNDDKNKVSTNLPPDDTKSGK